MLAVRDENWRAHRPHLRYVYANILDLPILRVLPVPSLPCCVLLSLLDRKRFTVHATQYLTTPLTVDLQANVQRMELRTGCAV